MKVKFNLPSKRYRNKLSFDSNTSFGCGNLQPLFAKFCVKNSKLNINFGQLTRLAPLVVPSFARLKQINDFVFVPISHVMPSFEAFMSQSHVYGSTVNYVPNSLPCFTNQALFNELVGRFAARYDLENVTNKVSKPASYSLLDYRGSNTYTNKAINGFSDIKKLAYDFSVSESGLTAYYKLNQDGRMWFTVLLGLGYSCDPFDDKPVSVLPLWSFVKAYYDLYYNKRYNAWLDSHLYNDINSHYNGDFETKTYSGHTYDMIRGDVIPRLFDDHFTFYMYAALDNSPLNVATSDPFNVSLSQTPSTIYNDVSSGTTAIGPQIADSQESNTFSLVDLGLANKLWDFISRSSVVGQSVKDWFKVHFGFAPSEDMYNTSILFAQKPNNINVNVVIASADGSNGDTKSRLGDLAGSAFGSNNGSVSFDVPTFGYVFCISGLIPLTRVSGGTQPEIYNTTLFDMPFPDFDGLGYETINNSSLSVSGDGRNTGNAHWAIPKGGFGYLPRYSSYKFCNNFRSGGFAIPSIRDSYLSYCEDTILDNNVNDLSPAPTPTNLKLNYPWRYDLSNFLSYNRIFYNQYTPDSTGFTFVDDNFMCQTAFDIDVTSYLKPLSDSYSIEELGKRLISSKVQ